MLTLKPNCECCDKDLPPASQEAMICSYECTFCADCVRTILWNVCPNCGGGFVPRPIRPREARRKNVSLTHQPASAERVHSAYTRDELLEFSSRVKSILPEDR
ncbi:MAG: DUF1272 domain-containing protein [Acidiferrobacterales bacterium]|nr:DUF1272 domain-containing protein [Acidiferrobacterales bacterium]